MKPLLVVAALVLACAPMSTMPTTPPSGMTSMGSVPPVKGFAEGQEILFIHTEASDAQVAQMLSDMMHSPVIVVPALADVPTAVLAAVYVFRDGVRGEGPFGFQADVFDRPAGTADYSPLRRIRFIRWSDAVSARVLRSVREIDQASAGGELAVEETRVVVNMPMVRWPGGQR